MFDDVKTIPPELRPKPSGYQELYWNLKDENLSLKKDVIFLDWLLQDHMDGYRDSLFSSNILGEAMNIYADEEEPEDDLLFWTAYGSAQDDRAKIEPVIAGNPCKGFDTRKRIAVDLPPTVIQ